MNIALTVVENFLSHVKGDVITDAAQVAEYLESEYQGHFVKTSAEAAPSAAADPAAE